MNGDRFRLLMTVDTVGGVWQYATDLATALAAWDVETVLAVLGPAATAQQRADALAVPGLELIDTGLPLDWMADSPEAVLAAGEGIAAIAAERRVDLVQLNQPSLSARALFIAPVVAVSHSCMLTWWQAVEGGLPPGDFAWRARLHKKGLQAAQRVVCPSAAFAKATQRAYALRALPHVVHNGRSPLTHPSVAMHDFALTVGRLWDRGKDVATLDRAAARLGVPVKAAGATCGPNGDAVAFQYVHAIGSIGGDRLADCLAAKPVFVSTARYEPFGLAVLEAAAAGCALVLSDIPTFRELWGEVATLVAPGDDRAFGQAIEELIGDTRFRLAQGELARRAAGRFSIGRMAAGMADVYAALMPQRTVRRSAA